MWKVCIDHIIYSWILSWNTSYTMIGDDLVFI